MGDTRAFSGDAINAASTIAVVMGHHIAGYDVQLLDVGRDVTF